MKTIAEIKNPYIRRGIIIVLTPVIFFVLGISMFVASSIDAIVKNFSTIKNEIMFEFQGLSKAISEAWEGQLDSEKKDETEMN